MSKGHAHERLGLTLGEALLERLLVDARIDEDKGGADAEEREHEGEEVEPRSHHQDGAGPLPNADAMEPRRVASGA